MNIYTKYFILLISIVILGQNAMASVITMDTQTLTNEASDIAIGEVTAIESKWNNEETKIFSYITISVNQNIKSNKKTNEISIKIPGGEVGDTKVIVSDIPVFEVGEEVLLFVKGDNLVGAYQGKYKIKDNKVLETGLTVDEFVKKINNGENVPRNVGFEAVAECYSYCGQKWYGPDPMEELYYVNPNTLDTTGELVAINTAADSWSNAGADFSFKYGGTTTSCGAALDDINVVCWLDTWEDNPGIIAVSWRWVIGDQITETDIEFNDQYFTWGTDGSAGKMDIQNIGIHELGHWLCLLDLYDPADSEKTMYGYASTGETKKRTLDQCDIDGIKSIYGAASVYDYCINDGYYDINFDISVPWLYGIEDTTSFCGYDTQTVGFVEFPHFFMYNDIDSASAICNEGYFEYCDWSNYPSPGSCIWRNIPGGTGTGSLSFCSANIESSSSPGPLSK